MAKLLNCYTLAQERTSSNFYNQQNIAQLLLNKLEDFEEKDVLFVLNACAMVTSRDLTMTNLFKATTRMVTDSALEHQDIVELSFLARYL